MPRLQTQQQFGEQRNPWGVQGGRDPQRTDLWTIDFSNVVAGIVRQSHNNTFETLTTVSNFQVIGLNLPELKVKADVVKRDSRPYFMPGEDEPVEPIKVRFIADSRPVYQDNLSYFLQGWRALTRAGRGSMSTENFFDLNRNYSIDFAFDVTLQLLRGGSLGQQTLTAQPKPLALQSSQNTGLPDQASFLSPNRLTFSQITKPVPFKTDFEISYILRLTSCWLSSFRWGELNHAENRFIEIEATLYAEDIQTSATGVLEANGRAVRDFSSAQIAALQAAILAPNIPIVITPIIIP